MTDVATTADGFGGGDRAPDLSVVPEKISLTNDQVEEMSQQLGAQIASYYQETGTQVDALVAIPRGSYGPMNVVSRLFKAKADRILHACISSYQDAGVEEGDHFTYGQMPSRKQVKGKNLLVIEEVCDSGETLTRLVDYLYRKGATDVKVGVLHYKPTKSKTGFRPDWFVEETDKWIEYPWEANEHNSVDAVLLSELGKKAVKSSIPDKIARLTERATLRERRARKMLAAKHLGGASLTDTSRLVGAEA
jgi:uncharacterized protein